MKKRDDEENDDKRMKMMKKNRLDDVGSVEKGKKDKNDKDASFNPHIINIMLVESVVYSLHFSEMFFSRYSGFPLTSKTNISKFQFDQEQ